MTTTCRSLVLNLAAAVLGLTGSPQTLDAEPLPAGVPVRVQLSTDLQRVAARMIERSATFRSQLERLGSACGLAVTAHLDPAIEHRSYRARSVIHRLRTGELVAVVAIGAHGSPVEWLAHEFEHILEQVEGLHLPSLAGRTNGVWRSGSGEMFETARAIRIGRRVAGEMSAARGRQTFLSNQAYRQDEIVGPLSLAP
jgi:hypothetical protein